MLSLSTEEHAHTVCMYVRTYMCMYMCIVPPPHTHTPTHRHTHPHTHTHTHTHNTRTHKHARTHARTHTHTDTHTHTHTHGILAPATNICYKIFTSKTKESESLQVLEVWHQTRQCGSLVRSNTKQNTCHGSNMCAS